eukprot:CAMPEP_0173246754 /NCGR_PEP_ID=MMETSP1142-20121109/17507_1 /TAXON_ID=483371 /ORGANISM="non described non described, Strain CCMP2298" /LENGTH=96 /DNA_ID=CAMNT_0014179041 /DNA_START=64 /DNA_END=355 /DNA_ORIENTATION=-
MTSEAREEHRRCQKQASRKRCAAAAAADPVEQTRLRVLNCSRKKKQRSQNSDFLLKEEIIREDTGHSWLGNFESLRTESGGREARRKLGESRRGAG